MDMSLSTAAFAQIRQHVYDTAGIIINANKSAMVVSRLWRRVEALDMASLDAYVAFVVSTEGAVERARMLDLLTTNETYFFREPAHFTRLRNQIIPALERRPLRVWCAAASSGEEPYSIAMVLADVLGYDNWTLMATDISTRVLEQARRGLYRMQRLEQMPPDYLRRFCRRGVDEFDGKMVIDNELRQRVQFRQHNLLKPLAGEAPFDIIFLRNVLIYFDQPTKRRVIQHLLRNLRPQGWLIVGHCESLHGTGLPVTQISPSIYRYCVGCGAGREKMPA